jgi:6-phosphogluconate dehydrogenase
VWRRGSVISSWLLDLTAQAFVPRSRTGAIRRARLGLGRGPLDEHRRDRRRRARNILTLALYERFSSRGEGDFADQVLSAMRFGFGGHLEKKDA